MKKIGRPSNPKKWKINPELIKKLKVFSQNEKRKKYNVFCPICKKKIKGIGKQHCITNFRLHFQIIHPDYEFGEFLFTEEENE